MNEIYLQKIITEHARNLEKRINLRVMMLLDPSCKNPTERMLAVYAPGMMHITPEKMTGLLAEFEFETEKFLQSIILKDEDKIPRTIYVSTDTRRIVLRFLRMPNKSYELAPPEIKASVPKYLIYYLGISIIKNMENVGKEKPEEKPQAVFDEMDLIINDLKKAL